MEGRHSSGDGGAARQVSSVGVCLLVCLPVTITMSGLLRGWCALLALAAAVWAASEGDGQCPPPPARDCSDLEDGAVSGVRLLVPGLRHPVPALCDDGWTVLQRRADITPRQDFFLGWQAYKWGFGQLDAEFWWGLEHLWRMTSLLDRRYELRIDLEDFENRTRYALYQDFSISPEEDGYRLTVSNYTGTATDSLSQQHSGMQFSTRDRDNDQRYGSCAEGARGAWWYRRCFTANLNGPYRAGDFSELGKSKAGQGITWNAWTGGQYSLKSVTMKVRPTKKL